MPRTNVPPTTKRSSAAELILPVPRLRNNFQRRNLVAFKLEEEPKVNRAAGKVSHQMAGDNRLSVLLFAR